MASDEIYMDARKLSQESEIRKNVEEILGNFGSKYEFHF